MTVQTVLLIGAVLCFTLAALGVAVGSLLLVPLGLALFAAAHIG